MPDDPRASNLTTLSGCLLEREALRYTPAGIPVIEFLLGHHSQQIESGHQRQVDLEMPCVATGSAALLLSGLLEASEMHQVRIEGFLAARSLKRRTPVLHVTHIEFVEGS